MLDCGALSTKLDDGSAAQTGTKYLDTTVYTCNVGYMFSVGNVTLNVTCQADGNWSGSVPQCIQTGKNTCTFTYLYRNHSATTSKFGHYRV